MHKAEISRFVEALLVEAQEVENSGTPTRWLTDEGSLSTANVMSQIAHGTLQVDPNIIIPDQPYVIFGIGQMPEVRIHTHEDDTSTLRLVVNIGMPESPEGLILATIVGQAVDNLEFFVNPRITYI